MNLHNIKNNGKKNILLHCCCGPCSVMIVDKLTTDGYTVTPYFFNPNIHPFTEYSRRRDSWLDYIKTCSCEYILNDEYLLESFLESVANRFQDRCIYCYSERLERTGKKALEMGFSFFSTTLLISPYQNRDLLLSIGEKLAKNLGIGFLGEDYRPLFRTGQKKAKDLGLYRQQYCGCIYSEKERYIPKK